MKTFEQFNTKEPQIGDVYISKEPMDDKNIILVYGTDEDSVYIMYIKNNIIRLDLHSSKFITNYWNYYKSFEEYCEEDTTMISKIIEAERRFGNAELNNTVLYKWLDYMKSNDNLKLFYDSEELGLL